MQLRPLGHTGLQVSPIAFGAGPIAGLMTGDDRARQTSVVRRALDLGVNWFDTAATYGQGESERNLGGVLRTLGAADAVQVATKVRLQGADLLDISAAIRRSVDESLARLDGPRITLLQLHNAITGRRDDEPTSLTPTDVLGPGGVLETFERLRDEGRIQRIGLTGIGQAEPLREVIASGRFETLQVPYSLVNPSAGQDVPADFPEANYGNVIRDCGERHMGVFAIRVLAGGALAGREPSPYTHVTKFFPLDLYRRDQRRASEFAEQASSGPWTLVQSAIRFALAHPLVSAAIIGFGSTAQVDEAVQATGN